VLAPDLPALRGIETPALVLDRAALMRNLAAMAESATVNRIALRPHAKTHKSAEIARLQVEAGAIGICCATVAEIEAMAAAGLPGLMLTTPVSDAPKLARLAAIARGTALALVVDHPDQVTMLGAHLGGDGPPLQVLVDIDVGQRRTGVCAPPDTVALARAIAATPRVTFAGIQGFAGHVQHMVDADERKIAAAGVAAALHAHLAALRAAGFSAEIVTGSGTGACAFDTQGPYTELQVGSYVFMDADYGRLGRTGGGPLPYEPSLFVLATVTSINRDGEFTVDAGVKALAFNGPPPTLMLGAPEGSTYRFGGDEHGMITMPPGHAAPALGSRILLLTTHCDPTVNLHGRYHVVDVDGRVTRWPVLGRYGS